MQSLNRIRPLTPASPHFRRLAFRGSGRKLFVGGLSYDTNETILKDVFGQHGEIIEVKVICNHVSGISKGYGFVLFTSEDEARLALKEMDGQFLDGRNIRVTYAHKGKNVLRIEFDALENKPVGRTEEQTRTQDQGSIVLSCILYFKLTCWFSSAKLCKKTSFTF